MTDSAVTDLPDPDSPTSAWVSPLPMVRLAPCTAVTAPFPAPKVTCRSSISNSLDII